MEEKESTVSGSMSDSGSDSPSPVTSYAAATAETMVVGETTPTEPFSINMTNTNSSGLVTPFSGTMTSSGGQNTAGSNGGDVSEKKKRGRPRKYDSQGNLIVRSQILSPAKKNRGRDHWSLLASFGEQFARTAGEDFTPHIITVNTGEDLAGKILSFTQKGPRGVCVLSAIGAVSNVTIRHSGSSCGILTYEGRFEILTLTGSFVITEIGGVRNKTGGLSVSLAGPDGRVVGGVVVGGLTASSPIQVVIGSFLTFAAKPKKRKYERRTAITPALPSASPDAVAAEAKHENETAFGGQQQQPPQQMGFVWSRQEADPNLRVISPDINVTAPKE